MKILIKTFCAGLLISLAFASCRKADLSPISTAENSAATQFKGLVSIADSTIISGENIFTNKDKCKKCHTTTSKNIDWSPPYQPTQSITYGSMEELINNYDFVNNVHLALGQNPTSQISDVQKQELLMYLNNLALKATENRNK